MSETFDKLVERIPYFEGDFRRRLGSGVIVVIAILVAVSLVSSISAEDMLKFLTEAPSILILIAILAYMIGHLTEMVSDIFIARFAGNLAWALIAPLTWFSSWSSYLKYPARTICWLFFGLLMMWYFFRSLFGVSDYEWRSLENRLSKHSLSLFNTLPIVVQTGLRQPFGIYQDVAWNHLKQIADPNAKLVIIRQCAQCRDVLSISGALLIALGILSMVPSINFSFIISEASGSGEKPLIFANVLMYTFLMLLIGYMHTVWKAIITALEVISITLPQANLSPRANQENQYTNEKKA